MTKDSDNHSYKPDPRDPDEQLLAESRLTELLRQADRDQTGPDEDFLRELEEKSLNAFMNTKRTLSADASQIEEQKSETSTDSESVRCSTATSIESNIGSRRMLVVGLAATFAAILAAFAYYWPTDDVMTLGQVIDRTLQSKTMQLELTHDEQKLNVWATHTKVRLELDSKRYQIGNQQSLWQVDESIQRVTELDQSYFSNKDEDSEDSEVRVLDLLSLLAELLPKQLSEIRALEPTEQVSIEGCLCDHYQWNFDSAYDRLVFNAYVDAKTNLLREMEIVPDVAGTGRAPARLKVVNVNSPIDEEMFAISETLSPRGLVGQVVNVQGSASVKPVMQSRWSQLRSRLGLETGDWIRTGPRGPNAVKFKLNTVCNVTVGPDSMLELESDKSVRLLDGQVQLKLQEGESLTLRASDGQEIEATGDAVYLLKPAGVDGKRELFKLPKKPLWLQGFEGTTNQDSTGSLVATIDGRDVPLTVGHHKVSVDIRDQIARTVIDQTFVNNTNSTLEGVFYFPLPQDASISGFGMWINGELVEADVVEKQRAREIFETILREKRDPALLEWTGGNIFKARVFPILGNSEKRIKITYTQVLPRRGNKYVYRYSLESEMLRQTPLSQLAIDVKVNSSVPLTKVSCPTHETRDELTENSAHVEFARQEYSPKRDFEVAVEVANSLPSLVAIPHRRGDDGYFLLQMTPPGGSGAWQPVFDRNMIPDGDPVKLLIVADTSASMSESARRNQTAFITSLISSLSKADQFDVAVCDVDCTWKYDELQPASADAAEAVGEWLDNRESLGWTDLERTFQNVLKRAQEGTRVIYVGDGTVNTYSADNVAFANRLKRMFQDSKAVFHSVTVGNSYESIVLQAMASIGGGSLHSVSGERGERTPEQVAFELLNQIARPAIRDLEVSFEGVKVARVYPGELPNLTPGTQQILVGRYLPEGADRQGTVTITGRRAGQSFSWKAPIVLKDAEKGNSFIPRLWARAHLDFLLRQGATADIQDQIIDLSERFHIITPYTSLLVLESDADRERFGVKRRFRIRDGERFFADGRDNANFELRQKQMKAAGSWRIGMQRTILQSFVGFGRVIDTGHVCMGRLWR